MLNKITKILFSLLLVCLCLNPSQIKADEFIDEITNYEITVEPNEDSTLNIKYHIEWLVLDDEEGPLIWAEIGLPNKHYVSLEALSDNIENLTYQSSSNCVRVEFNKDYYKDETAIFEFEVVQDYMWSFNDDKAECAFTPAWFDYADVDNLTIKWKTDKVDGYWPSASVEDNYLIWNTSLKGGEKFTIYTYYEQDAFAFDYNKEVDNNDYEDYEEHDTATHTILSIIWPFVMIYATLHIIRLFIRKAKENDDGFTYEDKKTIKKTKIKYYNECPNCGASREEGQDICPFCRTSFIESEEVIEEDNPEYKKYNDDEGTYRTSSPNTYVNVIVHNTRVRTSKPRSSCAHSSCAHSSCAHSNCACACASSHGGRAGCSVKNFYQTGLTIEQINKRNKLKK